MADSNRTQTDPLGKLRAVQAAPHEYGFFSLIRQLDCLFPGQPRTGTADRPANERVRIGQVPSLKFAPSTLADFEPRSGDQVWNLRTHFFGVFGPNGAMPIHLSEFAHLRIQHNRDNTFAKFCDVFHHRLATFFYRAWADCQPTVHADRPDSNRFGLYIGSLCGLGTTAVQNGDALPDPLKLSFAGHLGASPRHASGLQSMLSTYFRLPVEIEPFVSHWIDLPENCLWRLGKSEDSSRLGNGTVLGSRVHDCQQRFRIIMGPMSFADFQRLMPDADGMRRLAAIVDNYVGYEYSWELQLVLQKEEVRRFQLGTHSRLGWNTWIRGHAPSKDAADLVLNPSSKSASPERKPTSRENSSQPLTSGVVRSV